MQRHPPKTAQRGVVVVVFAISALALVLLFGLAIDTGFLYMTRAALSKGTDAAALMGVRNISQGESAARLIAQSTFTMNYVASGVAGRQVEAPVVTVTFTTDQNNNKRINVNATVRVNTFFIRVLPGLSTVSIGSSAQAMRAKLIMSVVLDRSGSMLSNGGASALPPAVETFINLFDNTSDQVALASYADYARLDVSMRYNFKSTVISKVKTMAFGGWTYAHGGMDIGRQQINNTPVPTGENVFKALVFFTDGQANSFLNTINCTGSQNRSLVLVPGSNTDDFRDPANGSSVTCNANRTRNFFSQKYQQNRTRNSSNVEEEGLFMAERSAQLTREDGTTVFAIGLGNDINKTSLRKMANDPASPSYNPSQPVGVAAFAPASGDLDDVFRQIAAKILLRLTR